MKCLRLLEVARTYDVRVMLLYGALIPYSSPRVFKLHPGGLMQPVLSI